MKIDEFDLFLDELGICEWYWRVLLSVNFVVMIVVLWMVFEYGGNVNVMLVDF